jgi:hypothetical protein
MRATIVVGIWFGILLYIAMVFGVIIWMVRHHS